MGLQIGEIITKNEIEFSQLKGKTLAVDAFNAIYQFLTTIRQSDGTPLKNSAGDITSHISGLFYRNMRLILEGIKLIYVFDGEPPELKTKTRELRREQRDLAKEKYNEAVDKEDIEGMNKYSRSETSLDERKIKESIELLEAMGIAIIQAPGEGEAQASYIVEQGRADAVASQDYDCLMFKAPLLIQNLSLSKTRKTISGFKEVFPQTIKLDQILKELEVNQEQLICLGIICGTDYNPGGIKGLGPKKGLKIVQEYKTKEAIFKALQSDEKFEKYSEFIDFDWQPIFEEINNPNIDKNPEIIFPKLDPEKIKEILLKYEFSENRINSQLDKLENLKKQAAQKTLF
jgi:flap endonuclease-1